MQNMYAIFQGSREGYTLLSNKDGNNGRALRRYLSREVYGLNGVPDGAYPQMVHQVFAFDSGFSKIQLDAIEAYAKELFNANAVFIKADGGLPIGSIRDEAFGLIQNSYYLAHPIASASVAQLRNMVELVVVLFDTMQAYASRPNENALKNCPDYLYRGLTVSCSFAPWCIMVP